MELELQALPRQPGHDQREDRHHGVTGHGRKFRCNVVSDQQARGDQASLENRHRIAVVFKRRAGEMRIVVEVAHLADFRPRGIYAERDDVEQQIDDPDAEVFGARTGKSQTLGTSGVARVRLKSRRRWAKVRGSCATGTQHEGLRQNRGESFIDKKRQVC